MTQIFAGNLPFSTSESDIRQAFESFGRVTSVRLMADHSTNRSRGFAFVTMPSLDDADEAIKRMSGSSLHGRQITVNEAARKKRDPVPTNNGCDRAAAMAMFAALLDD